MHSPTAALWCLMLCCACGPVHAFGYLDGMPYAAPPAQQAESRPGIRTGDWRPAEQLTVDLFGRPLTIGGEYEFLYEYREDFTLGDDNDSFMGHALSLEFFYEISDSVFAFVDLTTFYSDDIDIGDPNRKLGLDRGQAWVLFEEIFDSNVDIQVGSIYFSEEREWWWDSSLEALSVQYWGEWWEAEIYVGEQLAAVSTVDEGIDPEYEDVLWVLGRAGREILDTHFLEFFVAQRYDHSPTEAIDTLLPDALEDESDDDLTWVGIRSSGLWMLGELGDLHYWLDTAYVHGTETSIFFEEAGDDSELLIVDDIESQKVSGWAVDLGLTLQTNWRLNPYFTMRYAVASGDSNEDDDTNTAFRQTGLQENNDGFGDLNRFYYYGELLQPELSNLEVWTVSAGLPLLNNSFLEVVYHQYDQHVATDFLRDVNIDMDPFGENDNIGQELDVIVGFREWMHWEVEAVAGLFKAGDAFGDLSGNTSAGVLLNVDFNF